jgi:hypothetical protein
MPASRVFSPVPEGTPMAKAKASLPITREMFRTSAKPIVVVIDGKEYKVPKKEFSTGSLGWYLNEKMDVEIGGETVKVQIGLNLTIVGSKDLPQDKPAAAPAPPSPAAGDDGGEDGSGQADF